MKNYKNRLIKKKKILEQKIKILKIYNKKCLNFNK